MYKFVASCAVNLPWTLRVRLHWRLYSSDTLSVLSLQPTSKCRSAKGPAQLQAPEAFINHHPVVVKHQAQEASALGHRADCEGARRLNFKFCTVLQPICEVFCASFCFVFTNVQPSRGTNQKSGDQACGRSNQCHQSKRFGGASSKPQCTFKCNFTSFWDFECPVRGRKPQVGNR